MQPKKWIVRSDKVLGGMPVFTGTRVPVPILLDYLEAGQSIEEFLDDFPTVDHEHVVGALKSLKQMLLSQPKEIRVRDSDLFRTRSSHQPVKPNRQKEKISRHLIESQKDIFSSEESKYRLVLERLCELGWQPKQLSGRERTAYALNSNGTILAIFRHAMKQKGSKRPYFFGLSKTNFERHISQRTVYIFLQCANPSSVLIIPGDYFQKCYKDVPTSAGDWKINVYTDGKTWELKPTGKSHFDVTKHLNQYPHPS
jgi:uncharacterized protein (DUF433 family)